MKVLIGCLGSQNAINVVQSLRSNHQIETLIGMDANPNCAGRDLVDVFYQVPKTSHIYYMERILSIIDAEGIDVFLPIHSAEVRFFSEHKSEFESKTEIPLCIPSFKLFNDLDDKYIFSQTVAYKFKDIDFENIIL